MEITKREIVFSIIIAAVMIFFGFFIAGKISDKQMDQNEKYYKAVKIVDAEQFEYGMATNVGNAFVTGDLCGVDTVSYPDIEGEYLYVRKEREEYTRHTRRVYHSTGKSGYYTTEVYYTWDYAGHESKRCEELSFCGHVFPSEKIELSGSRHIDTVYQSSCVRYVYYGIAAETYTGTVFTVLGDNTISDGTDFYSGYDIAETLEFLEIKGRAAIFWVIWIAAMAGIVGIFYYIDNRWLE